MPRSKTGCSVHAQDRSSCRPPCTWAQGPVRSYCRRGSTKQRRLRRNGSSTQRRSRSPAPPPLLTDGRNPVVRDTEKQSSRSRGARNRKSIGDSHVLGQALEARRGRSELCDLLPNPKSRYFELRRIGDYHQFADTTNLSQAMAFLAQQVGEYAMVGNLYCSIDENLKHDAKFREFDLPSECRKDAVEYLRSLNPGKYSRTDLESRVHYFAASLRTSEHVAFDFACFRSDTDRFEPIPAQKNESFREFVRLLQDAKATGRCLVIPFDSFSITSAHMCTLVVAGTRVEPKVYVFDPNGPSRRRSPSSLASELPCSGGIVHRVLFASGRVRDVSVITPTILTSTCPARRRGKSRCTTTLISAKSSRAEDGQVARLRVPETRGSVSSCPCS